MSVHGCHSHLYLFVTFSPTFSLPTTHLLSPARTFQSYFLLACLLSKPALCQCIRLIQSPVHMHSNVMTHDIQLMLLPPSWVGSAVIFFVCMFVWCVSVCVCVCESLNGCTYNLKSLAVTVTLIYIIYKNCEIFKIAVSLINCCVFLTFQTTTWSISLIPWVSVPKYPQNQLLFWLRFPH